MLQRARLQARLRRWDQRGEHRGHQAVADQGHAVLVRLQQPGAPGVRPVLLWADHTAG